MRLCVVDFVVYSKISIHKQWKKKWKMIYRHIYSFKRVIVLLLMLSDDKIILVQTQTKYCDMFRGDLYRSSIMGVFQAYIWAKWAFV